MKILKRPVFFILPLTLFFIGCAPGFIYTDITEPECVDMRSTPIGEKTSKGGLYKIELPFTKVNLTAEWNTRGLGDVAKKGGISTIYYCDLRTLSILGGIYRKQETIVYGK